MVNKVVQKVVQGESGEQRVTNTQKVDMLAGYHPAYEAGWGIVSQTPTGSIIETSQKIIIQIILYSIPLLLIIVALIYGLISYISKPLNKLATFTEELSNNYEVAKDLPLPHRWNYEANQLYHTFSLALNNIQNHVNALSDEAQTDPLTGLNNRRYMEMVLSDWKENQIPFCYIIMDIDHFKSVNDNYGHPTGDEVIKFLAAIIQTEVYKDDICCRYGGEEFTVLSPQGDLTSGVKLAEKIRGKIGQTNCPIGKPITISLGVAISNGRQDIEKVKQSADEALYRAKSNGRNRVES